MNKKQKAEWLKLLEDDNHYYGDFGQKFLSYSKIGTLLNNPAGFMDQQDQNVNMLIGGYLHTIILEPEKINTYKVIEASTRNTKVYKEMSDGELCLLQHEVDKIELLRDKLLANEVCENLIHGNKKTEQNISYEIPGIAEIYGNLWKGKADIINKNENLIIDIKTTSDVDGFRYSARKFNYDCQAYIYRQLFDLDMMFIAIDKSTHKIAIFECSEEFYDSGQDKVMRATDMYNLFYKTEGFDPSQYFESKIL
jgi:hypothetical protein|tara:strand:- start:6257 stop:7012 length:756 start_codon:yes stop_codon:yes gene_type:complete